jgi:hypothetical protein
MMVRLASDIGAQPYGNFKCKTVLASVAGKTIEITDKKAARRADEEAVRCAVKKLMERSL